MARLLEKYRNEIRPALKEQFGIKNDLAVPRLEKIVVNMGVGEAKDNPKKLDMVAGHLARITGQKPKITKSKKAVASWRLREDMPLGCTVTMRNKRMYEFLDRLVNLAIPRIRDFRGLSFKAFDGSGNYTMGLGEQSVFPEVPVERLEDIQGMDITLVTSTRNDEESYVLLRSLGLPLREKKKQQ